MEDSLGECWWATLDKNESLELAFILSRKVLILWDKFDSPDIDLRNKLKAIKSLPNMALKEIDAYIKNKNENFDIKRLNKLFTLFVTPVLQIRDGNLKLPYVVKSTFLSVFNILKGILSSKDKSQILASFTLSISRSLDAIKFSNILTPDEVSVLTRKYFLLSRKK